MFGVVIKGRTFGRPGRRGNDNIDMGVNKEVGAWNGLISMRMWTEQ
jgi:hypothetical protein